MHENFHGNRYIQYSPTSSLTTDCNYDYAVLRKAAVISTVIFHYQRNKEQRISSENEERMLEINESAIITAEHFIQFTTSSFQLTIQINQLCIIKINSNSNLLSELCEQRSTTLF